jgi:hypothetical protein
MNYGNFVFLHLLVKTKMKQFTSLVFFICIFSHQSSAQRLIHDTLFFQRDIKQLDSNSRHPHIRIHYSGRFLEKNKSSRYYKYILDYNFKKITPAGDYNPNGKIDIYAIREIPRKWYPVIKYKGKFYISSLDSYNKDLLTDTALLERRMEGVFSNGLNSFKKINKNTFQLNANTWHNKTFNLKIHIIDPAKGLAVFEYFTSGDEKHDYRLMVGGENNIRSFPMIASFSQTRILPDTTWHLEEPANFYIEFFDAKSLLNKNNSN